MRKTPDKKFIKEVDNFFKEAKIKARDNPEAAKKIVALARKRAKRENFSLKKYNKLFCKKCNSFFVAGKNCAVRIKKGKLNIKCFECGAYKRFGLKIS
ncbi:MAG: ribonuclease P [Candidatus Pacearchaeota archaeon]|nr:ribonuclease P [Candidatus Pacearchaeota archaeon]